MDKTLVFLHTIPKTGGVKFKDLNMYDCIFDRSRSDENINAVHIQINFNLALYETFSLIPTEQQPENFELSREIFIHTTNHTFTEEKLRTSQENRKKIIPIISGALSGLLVPSLLGDPFASDCTTQSVASLDNTPPYDVVGKLLSP